MKYKIRLTCPDYLRDFHGYSTIRYSDRMENLSGQKSEIINASLKDAETLQRLNPQHEVDIWSTYDECYLPLWFFRKYEDILFRGIKMPISYYIYTMWFGGTPYEPSHPIVSQAPKFIYRPSDRFLIKKALYGMVKRGWRPCYGVTGPELAKIWASIFKEQMNGKHT